MTTKRRSSVALLGASLFTMFTFFAMLQSIDKGEVWRIALSALGFTGFLTLTLLVARRAFR